MDSHRIQQDFTSAAAALVQTIDQTQKSRSATVAAADSTGIAEGCGSNNDDITEQIQIPIHQLQQQLQQQQLQQMKPEPQQPPIAESPPVEIQIWSMTRIDSRKFFYKALSRSDKILKLSIHSGCKKEGCTCTGWKTIDTVCNQVSSSDDMCEAGPHEKMDTSSELTCGRCNHSLDDHVAHLANFTDEALDLLTSAMVDIETISMVLQRDPLVDDPDVKKLFCYVFALLRQSIRACSQPKVNLDALGHPPYEAQSISKAIPALVPYKYNHVDPYEWDTVGDLAKWLLFLIYKCKMNAPSASGLPVSSTEYAIYNQMYRRWLLLCHLPSYCDSLEKKEVNQIFGRVFFKEVYPNVKQQILDDFDKETAKIEPLRKELYKKMLPGFLENLEEVISNPHSPIWDANFKPTLSPHAPTLPPPQPPANPLPPFEELKAQKSSANQSSYLYALLTAPKRKKATEPTATPTVNEMSIPNPVPATPTSEPTPTATPTVQYNIPVVPISNDLLGDRFEQDCKAKGLEGVVVNLLSEEEQLAILEESGLPSLSVATSHQPNVQFSNLNPYSNDAEDQLDISGSELAPEDFAEYGMTPELWDEFCEAADSMFPWPEFTIPSNHVLYEMFKDLVDMMYGEEEEVEGKGQEGGHGDGQEKK